MAQDCFAYCSYFLSIVNHPQTSSFILSFSIMSGEKSSFYPFSILQPPYFILEPSIITHLRHLFLDREVLGSSTFLIRKALWPYHPLDCLLLHFLQTSNILHSPMSWYMRLVFVVEFYISWVLVSESYSLPYPTIQLLRVKAPFVIFQRKIWLSKAFNLEILLIFKVLLEPNLAFLLQTNMAVPLKL